MHLLDLHDHVLITIFEKCASAELENLYHVCVRFQDIIDKFILSKRCRTLLMAHLHRQTTFFYRTNKQLSNLQRLRVADNWTCGRYLERTLCRHTAMYPSYLYLDSDHLYMSHGSEIRVYNRQGGQLETRPVRVLCGTIGQRQSASDITAFVKRGERIFGGNNNGSICLWPSCSADDDDVREMTADDRVTIASINSVDMDAMAQTFVVASKNELIVLNRCEELGLMTIEACADIQEEYKTIRLATNGRQIAAGKYIDRDRSALELIDLETMSRLRLNSQTTSIYNLLWRDENCLLTANYDSTLRLFDLRSNCDELIWMDPFDASMFSLDYDGRHGVVVGLNYHCRVNLYDLRVPKEYQQMFYPAMDQRSRGSPVYSVVADASQLFIATDHNLRVFDFECHWAEPKDYRNLFPKI